MNPPLPTTATRALVRLAADAVAEGLRRRLRQVLQAPARSLLWLAPPAVTLAQIATGHDSGTWTLLPPGLKLLSVALRGQPGTLPLELAIFCEVLS